jgi:hypothetical protein
MSSQLTVSELGLGNKASSNKVDDYHLQTFAVIKANCETTYQVLLADRSDSACKEWWRGRCREYDANQFQTSLPRKGCDNT